MTYLRRNDRAQIWRSRPGMTYNSDRQDLRAGAIISSGGAPGWAAHGALLGPPLVSVVLGGCRVSIEATLDRRNLRTIATFGPDVGIRRSSSDDRPLGDRSSSNGSSSHRSMNHRSENNCWRPETRWVRSVWEPPAGHVALAWASGAPRRATGVVRCTGEARSKRVHSDHASAGRLPEAGSDRRYHRTCVGISSAFRAC